MSGPAASRPRREARRADQGGWPRPETMLLAAVTALVCFGFVMVYSTSSATALLTQQDPTGQATRQVFYAVLGIAGYLVFVRMGPRGLRRLGPPLLAVALLMLVVVLIPGVGTQVNGAQRWIALPAFGTVQPSEIAKLALILWVAQLVARHPGALRDWRGLLPYFAVAATIALLIMLQPDMDTTLILGATLLAMLVVAGAHLRHLMAVAGAALGVAAMAIMAEPYRRERLLAFLSPDAPGAGDGHQALQAQIAVGVGGIRGVGLGDGVQKAFYLPEASSDMILATVGEELGLIGLAGVVLGFLVFAVAGFLIAANAPDLHQQVVATGITAMVVVQAFINMGAVLGLMPLAGLTLPFVSYGGSSLIVLLCCTGILVNIGRRTTSEVHAGRVVAVGDRRDRGRGDGRARVARAGGGRRAAGARG
ncbi:MAG: putative lipid II flippase FtsW [Miltoncostaeaceae bacterium]